MVQRGYQPLYEPTGGGAMFSIAIGEMLAKLPVAQLGQTLVEFVRPFSEELPDRRLQRVVPQAVQGILGRCKAYLAARRQW